MVSYGVGIVLYGGDVIQIAEIKSGCNREVAPFKNAFKHGVTAWRLVTRSALSNFVIVRL